MLASPMADRSGSTDALLNDADKPEVPPIAIYMLYLTIFIDTLAGSISTPVMPYYAKSFGVSTAMIGYLYGAWAFSSTVFAPGLSRLSDKWGRRTVLVMSLVGAGTANLMQGLAPNFWVFLFGRFFSGVWAAVGSTCNVYITDVVPESIRGSYYANLSMVPLSAILFGPGLGGGLSKLGLNVPIMVDAVITLFSAAVVAYYLPETPAFLRSKAMANVKTDGPAQEDTNIPCPVYFTCASGFLGGMMMSTMISSFAIFMEATYEFDALRVGFCFMGMGVVAMMTNVWIVRFLQKRMHATSLCALGYLINGIGLASFACVSNQWLALFFFGFTSVGQGIRSATGSSVVAPFTNTGNRGKIFGLVQMCQNCGRMVGPIMATHIAGHDVALPFKICCILGAVAACMTSLIPKPSPKQEIKAPLERKKTAFGEEWEDETGEEGDVKAIGQFVAELLTRRHYKWVSRRAQVEKLLETLLPELEIRDKSAYEASLAEIIQEEDLESSMQMGVMR